MDENDKIGDPSTIAAANASTRRRWPPRWFVLQSLASLGVIAWAMRTDIFFDATLNNIIIWVTLFLTLITFASWYFFFSGYTRRARAVTAIMSLCGLTVLPILFRIDGVTGTLAPSNLTWRWQPEHDRRLPEPESASGSDMSGDSRQADLIETNRDSFAQFLGPNRDGQLPTSQLPPKLSDATFRLAWRQPIGAGWSGFALVNRFAVTLEQRDETEWITCYDVENGNLVWSHGIEARHESVMGGVGPRSTPTIASGRVYALGGTGILRCLDGTQGKLLWQRNISTEFGMTPELEEAEIPWGRSNSPLVVDDLVIVPVGGHGAQRKSLVAFAASTGEIVWSAGDHQVSYSSPLLATLHGERQIICAMEDAVVAHDVTTGSLLWETAWPGPTNSQPNVSQPIVLPGNQLVLAKGYGGGCRLLQVAKDATGWHLEQLWHQPAVLRTKYTNAVFYEGHLFGLDDIILSCVRIADGKRIWKRGRYGHGQILRVGNDLMVMSEQGKLAIVGLTAEGFSERYRFQALTGMTWNTICLAGSDLLVRNGEEAACYRIAR